MSSFFNRRKRRFPGQTGEGDAGIDLTLVVKPSGQTIIKKPLTIIGDPGTEHIEVTDLAVNIKDGETIYLVLAGGILSVGNTANRHLSISEEFLSFKDGTTTLIRVGEDELVLGSFLTEYIIIDEDGLKLNTFTATHASLDGDVLTLGELATDVRTNGAFRLGNLTTTERNALSAANGMVIYNTTTNKFQGYENGSWVDLV